MINHRSSAILYLNFGRHFPQLGLIYDFVRHPFFFSGSSLDEIIFPAYDDEAHLISIRSIWNGFVSVYLLSTKYYIFTGFQLSDSCLSQVLNQNLTWPQYIHTVKSEH